MLVLITATQLLCSTLSSHGTIAPECTAVLVLVGQQARQDDGVRGECQVQKKPAVTTRRLVSGWRDLVVTLPPSHLHSWLGVLRCKSRRGSGQVPGGCKGCECLSRPKGPLGPRPQVNYPSLLTLSSAYCVPRYLGRGLMLPREGESAGGPRAPMAPWALRASAESALKQPPNPQTAMNPSGLRGGHAMETSLGGVARVGPSDGFRVQSVA